jgi:hypothetical protein
MTLADDKQFQHRQHLSSAIATCELLLHEEPLPTYIGWVKLTNIKRHLEKEVNHVPSPSTK